MASKAEAGPPDDEAARARSLALLEATHQFPCDYAVTVIAFNRDSVTEAVRSAAQRVKAAAEAEESAAAEALEATARAGMVAALGSYEARASKEGKYLSHRFTVRCDHAGHVLELYARLRGVEGVVTLL